MSLGLRVDIFRLNDNGDVTGSWNDWLWKPYGVRGRGFEVKRLNDRGENAPFNRWEWST